MFPRLLMSRRTIVLIAGVVVLLAAAAIAFARYESGSSTTPTATPTPKVSGTPVVAKPTATPCPTAVSSATETSTATSSRMCTSAPCPTAVSSATETGTQTSTATKTATKTATATRTATATARPTACPTPTPLPEQLKTALPEVLKQFKKALVIPHPAFVPGPLNGEKVSWAVAHRRPVAVIVENYSPDSRPQTGLNYASLVYETVAEDGITRFMAVYLENIAPEVGPIRSARVYFDAWANGMHVIFVHAGGNDDALTELFTLHNIQDLNEVAFEDVNYIAHVPFFVRSDQKIIPHNLYTYPPQVLTYLKSQHKQLTGNFPDSLPHRNPSAPAHRPNGGTIDINFSSPDYAVEYQYDHATNRYLRFMGGVPHVDAVTGHQLAPSNVVVLMASIAPDPKGGVNNPGAVYVQDTGKNKAYYFRDGKEFQGSWHKKNGAAPLKLLDSHGKPFKFNPGQTWIEVLPTTGSLNVTPGH
jgi:hypothetical protein